MKQQVLFDPKGLEDWSLESEIPPSARDAEPVELDNLTASKVQFDPASYTLDPDSVREVMAGRTPRPYQAEAVIRCFEQLDGGSRGTLLRSPTGTGKSFMCALAIREWLKRSDKHRVMVLLHDISLINQMARELRTFLKMAVGVEQAQRQVNMHSPYHPRVIVGSRASLGVREIEREDGTKEMVSRLEKFDPFEYEWLIVPDECHRWRWNLPSCKPVIEHFDQSPRNKRLGLSATPERSDKAKFDKLFPSVCLDYTYQKAVDDGWIVPYRNKWVNLRHVKVKNLEELKGKKILQEDLDKAFEEILTDTKYLRGIVEPVINQCEGRRTLVFCPDVRSSYAVAAEINKIMGHEAAQAVHGEVPKDVRELIYNRHKRGEITFLVVCGLCREGYDDPSLGAVAILRMVKSRALAEQMKGRVARVLPGLVDGLQTAQERKAAIKASEKPDGLIIDVTGVSGLGEVPSTAEILAEGLPDEVIRRVKDKVKKAQEEGLDISPEELIAEAEEEHKQSIEEAERKLAEIRAMIQTEVDYTVREVGNGEGGAPNKQGYRRGGSTPRQVDFLMKLGVSRETAESFTKGQAGAVIEQRKSLKGGAFRITFGKHAGKALRDLPQRYVRMMEWQNEVNGKFAEVMPHIERMWSEKESEWRDLFDGDFKPSPVPAQAKPASNPTPHTQPHTDFRPPTEGQIRLAERYGYPKPRSFGEGADIVDEINSSIRSINETS